MAWMPRLVATALASSVLVLLVGVAEVGDADDADDGTACRNADAAVVVSVERREAATLRVGVRGEILLDGARCGQATTANTESIAVTGDGAKVEVDLRGGSF